MGVSLPSPSVHEQERHDQYMHFEKSEKLGTGRNKQSIELRMMLL